MLGSIEFAEELVEKIATKFRFLYRDGRDETKNLNGVHPGNITDWMNTYKSQGDTAQLLVPPVPVDLDTLGRGGDDLMEGVRRGLQKTHGRGADADPTKIGETTFRLPDAPSADRPYQTPATAPKPPTAGIPRLAKVKLPRKTKGV